MSDDKPIRASMFLRPGRWVPEGGWLVEKTNACWRVAFEPETIVQARARWIEVRKNADEMRDVVPATEFEDTLFPPRIAYAFGSSAASARIGVGWNLAHITDPAPSAWPRTPAGWLAVVVHEVAHHLSPPHRKDPTDAWGRRQVHGRSFKKACQLIAERWWSIDDLDTYEPAKPWSTITIRRRVTVVDGIEMATFDRKTRKQIETSSDLDLRIERAIDRKILEFP